MSKKQPKKLNSKTEVPFNDGFIPSLKNDPYFVKKTQDAKAFLNKVGLPKELSRKA